MTIEDLRNPNLKSGFSHVTTAGGKGSRTWRAQEVSGQRYEDGTAWWGPARKTPEEAAQDYIDHKAGHQPVGRLTVNLNRAGHHAKQIAKGALRRRRSGRRRQAARLGYVYCIGEEGATAAVKIGYAGTPTLRIGSLQTGNPRKLVILGVLRGTKADERELHAEYQEHNILGEWFRPTARLLSEFDLEPEMIA